jgi:polyisoprenoid-binding protein YceI
LTGRLQADWLAEKITVKDAAMLTRSLWRGLALAGALVMPASAGEEPPPGTYRLDPAHARLVVDVDHLSFSRYLLFFRTMDATLAFDPAAPDAMTLQATIDTTSVETLFPDPAYDFNADLRGPNFLDAGAHPQATFTSTAVKLTGERTAEVTGDFTLRGITKPLTLVVRFNGGYGRQAFDPGGARIGFSATGAFNRSDFGMTYGIPAPGTTLGVADEVRLRIEAEFVNPEAP